MVMISKPRRVETYIRSQISLGHLRPGDRLPGENELSAELGVGSQTVKNVLVSLAAEGVLSRKQKLGTFVADGVQPASVAILSRAELLTAPRSGYHSLVLAKAIEMIDNHGYRGVIKVGHGETPEEFISSVHLLDSFVAKETVGLLSLVGLGPLAKRFLKAGIPVVSVVPAVPLDEHCVVLDYRRMYEMAGEYLCSNGHDDFVIMHAQPLRAEQNDRLTTELDRLRLEAVNGQRERLLSCPFSYTYGHAYGTFKRYWERGNRPSAIFFDEDAVFDVASRAILELGIKVPEELAIITAGNVSNEYHFSKSVTAIEFNAVAAVAAAWEILDRLIHNEKVENPVVMFQPQLRLGETA